MRKNRHAKNVVLASFAYGFCFAIAACTPGSPDAPTPAPAQPAQNFKVQNIGKTGEPANATIANLSVGTPTKTANGSQAVVLTFDVIDGSQTIRGATLTLTEPPAEKATAAGSEFSVGDRTYRVQAACHDLVCLNSAIVLVVISANRTASTAGAGFWFVTPGATPRKSVPAGTGVETDPFQSLREFDEGAGRSIGT